MKAWLQSLCFVIVSSAMYAQDQDFYATVDTDEIFMGSYLEVSFALKNQDGDNFQPPRFDDFDVLSGPNRRSSMSIVNGNVNKTLAYSYTLRPKSAGMLYIGEASIVTRSGTLNTKPIKINVFPATEKKVSGKDEVFIETILSDSQAVIGQQIVLSYKLYTRLDVRNVSFDMPSDLDGFFVQELKTSNERTKREIVNGQEYATKIIKRLSLFPQQKGSYSIASHSVDLGIASDRRSNSFFFNTMLDSKRVFTDAVQIEVDNNIPFEDGSFSGAVGQYEMDVSLLKRSVSTDDVINIKMRITGDGDSKTVLAPRWLESDSFDVYEPNIIEDEVFQSAGKLMHRKTFEYIIVPKVEGTFGLKPKFTFYNPDSLKYISIEKTLPSINVLKGSGSNVQLGSENLVDLPDIYRKTTLKKKNEAYYWGKTHKLGLILLTFLLSAIIGLSIYKKSKGDLDASEIRRKKAKALALERLKNLESLKQSADNKAFHEELTRVLKQFLSDKYQIPAFHTGLNDIYDQLSSTDVQGPLREQLIELLKKSEQAIYAPSIHSDLGSTYQKALALLTEISA